MNIAFYKWFELACILAELCDYNKKTVNLQCLLMVALSARAGNL